MNQSQQLDESQVEELKKRWGIDEKIAEKYDLPVGKVEKDLDPRIRKLIQEFLTQAGGN